MALRGSSGPMPWPLWGLIVTVVLGFLLGAHERHTFDGFTLVVSHGYWVLRLLMAYLLFAGALALLEMSPLTPRVAWGWLALAAALLTLPLFTLCVTMLDLLLGLPELGPDVFGLDSSGAALSAGTMVLLFGMESLYHLDNHLALCALIVMPRLLLQQRAEVALQTAPPAAAGLPVLAAGAAAAAPTEPGPPAFLERFDPPVTGSLLAVQAQEHYVRVITSEGAPCTLYRFGDALRELEGLCGLQVHRSFWVADAGVAALKIGRRGLRIVLRNGEQVPVSARHADLVQRRFGERLETVA
ncbi:MAG: LytTR family DNA-binding domain-containing protein [Kiloniellaceae bacterium]